MPLAKPLNLTLSGRYDRYALSDNSIDKLTFGSGLEFRPHPTLLVRGNYATSFRAPDMNYLFLNKQKVISQVRLTIYVVAKRDNL